MAATYIVLFGIFLLTSEIQGRPNKFLYERLMQELFPQEYVPRQIQASNGPTLVQNWPNTETFIGQVGGVAVDQQNQPYVFHRGSRRWGPRSFNIDDTFRDPQTQGAIKEDTILKFDKDSGKVIGSLGAGMFYMPHGLTIDKDGNIWVTDVALHQVMKIPSGSSTPTLTLGERFKPGNDDLHFCKPTDVAVASNGDFFVSDGYCNGRIMKFNKDGKFQNKWGHQQQYDTSSNSGFFIPHSVALIESRDLLCVADREHGRIQCFKAGLTNSSNMGEFYRSFTHRDFGAEIYAISYGSHPNYGDVLYAVNGDRESAARGFTLSLDDPNEMIKEEWAPYGNGFGQPHDVAVSPDGADIYVGDIDPHKPAVTRFRSSV